ncbi:hypothetical protein ACHAWF_006648 [Thalassiosira exigua]
MDLRPPASHKNGAFLGVANRHAMSSFILCLLLWGALVANGFAFAPPARPSSSHHRRHRLAAALTYDDWHATLHPLDNLGVEDDVSPRVRWDAANAQALRAERSVSRELVEVASAFLPVVVLVLLEIAYDNMSIQP